MEGDILHRLHYTSQETIIAIEVCLCYEWGVDNGRYIYYGVSITITREPDRRKACHKILVRSQSNIFAIFNCGEKHSPHHPQSHILK